MPVRKRQAQGNGLSVKVITFCCGPYLAKEDEH